MVSRPTGYMTSIALLLKALKSARLKSCNIVGFIGDKHVASFQLYD